MACLGTLDTTDLKSLLVSTGKVLLAMYFYWYQISKEIEIETCHFIAMVFNDYDLEPASNTLVMK